MKLIRLLVSYGKCRGSQTRGRDPFLGRQMFLMGRQSLPGLPIYLRFIVVCDILGLQKFCKYLERVAIHKSLRTPGLMGSVMVKVIPFSGVHCIAIYRPNLT